MHGITNDPKLGPTNHKIVQGNLRDLSVPICQVCNLWGPGLYLSECPIPLRTQVDSLLKLVPMQVLETRAKGETK